MADDAAPPPPVEDAPIISETAPEVSSAINAAPGGATLPTGDAGLGQLPTNVPAPAGSGQQATAPVAAGSGQPSTAPGTASSPKGGPGQLTSYTNVGTPGSQQVNVGGGGGKVNSPSAKGSSYQDQQGYTPPTPTGSGPGYGGGTSSSSGGSGPGYGGGSAPKQTAEELKQVKDEDSERNIREAQKKAEDAKRTAGPPPTSGKMASAQAAPSNRIVNGNLGPTVMMPQPGGAGPQKRAFFQAQADTLNAMLPYYKMAQGG